MVKMQALKLVAKPNPFSYLACLVPKCRVQYTGSLYVDTFETGAGNHFVKPVAPILVLTGGIGKPDSVQTRDFLIYCNYNWDKVLYIPGFYELKDDPDRAINNLRELSLHYKNVRVLCNETYVSHPHRTVFMGAPLLTDAYDDKDRSWLREEYSKWRNDPFKLVIATSGVPHKALLKAPTQKPGSLYPDVNAWLCGHTHGSNYMEFENGVLAAYNARGHADGPNDMEGHMGWSRTAALTVPENRPIDGSSGPLLA